MYVQTGEKVRWERSSMSHTMGIGEIENFRNQLVEEEKSSATIEKYVRDVKAFLDYAGNEAVAIVSKEAVIRFKDYLLEHYAITSVNSMLAAVNCFLKKFGWYDCVVKLLKVQREAFRSHERELSKEEYYRLLKAAKDKGNERLYYIMQCICSTGIRISELKFITVESLNTRQARVCLKGKTRTVLLPSELCRRLKEYVQKRAINRGSIFVTCSGKPLDRSNILHDMKALCEASGVSRKKIFPHNLRHLFACTYYQEEKDLSHLADILGHSSVNTTRIYTLVSGEEQAKQIDMLGLVP